MGIASVCRRRGLAASVVVLLLLPLVPACAEAPGSGATGPCLDRSGACDDGPPGRERPDGGGTGDTGGRGSDAGDTGLGAGDAAPEAGAGDDTGPAPGDAGATDLSPVDIGGTDVVTEPPPRTGSILTDPDSVYLTVDGVGSEQEQTIRVINQTGGPVTFTSATIVSAAPGFFLFDDPVNVTRENNGEISFTMRYLAQLDEDVEAEIRVFNSWNDHVTIPVLIVRKAGGPVDPEDPPPAPPCVRVNPRSINFGSVVRDGTVPFVSRTFTIENCGGVEISVPRLDRGRVLGLLPTPTSFQWHPTVLTVPMRLAAGVSETIEVTFTPGRIGPESGVIDVVTNVTGSERVQVNLSATTVLPPIEDLDVHLILRWDRSNGSDVDFHFYPVSDELFSCADCYYANMSPDWGTAGSYLDDPFLDIDDLEGPGPENINVGSLQPGEYVVGVHYYSDTGSGGDCGSCSPTDATATVEIWLRGVLAGTYTHHLDGTDDTWLVAQLSWPAGTVTPLGDYWNIRRGDYTWCTGL